MSQTPITRAFLVASGDLHLAANQTCWFAQKRLEEKLSQNQVTYAPDAEAAQRALASKAAMFRTLGLEVYLCGDVALQGGHA